MYELIISLLLLINAIFYDFVCYDFVCGNREEFSVCAGTSGNYNTPHAERNAAVK